MKEQAMKAEVKAVLDTLTEERNRIDRAIEALGSVFSVVKSVGRATGRGVGIDPKVKAQIAARMKSAGSGFRSETARALAREFNLSYRSIYQYWSRWARESGNNSAESQPETNATAIGIQ